MGNPFLNQDFFDIPGVLSTTEPVEGEEVQSKSQYLLAKKGEGALR